MGPAKAVRRTWASRSPAPSRPPRRRCMWMDACCGHSTASAWPTSSSPSWRSTWPPAIADRAQAARSAASQGTGGVLAHRGGGRNRGAPAVGVGGFAFGQGEEALLDGGGDRAAGAGADRNAVHGFDRRDLDRGAAEEDLVGDVQRLAR